MVKQRGGLIGNKTPISVRGRARGQYTAKRRGVSLIRGRGRGREWHVEKIRAHRQSLDEMIEEDPLFQSSQRRNVKNPKKIAPTYTKGRKIAFNHHTNSSLYRYITYSFVVVISSYNLY